MQATLNAVALAMEKEIPFHWLWILSGTTYPIASNDSIRAKLASHHPESVGGAVVVFFLFFCDFLGFSEGGGGVFCVSFIFSSLFAVFFTACFLLCFFCCVRLLCFFVCVFRVGLRAFFSLGFIMFCFLFFGKRNFSCPFLVRESRRSIALLLLLPSLSSHLSLDPFVL